jgi:hypothetical protein
MPTYCHQEVTDHNLSERLLDTQTLEEIRKVTVSKSGSYEMQPTIQSKKEETSDEYE